MKTKWLDRRIAAPGPYMTLCLSEAEYLAALKHCKVDPAGAWISNAWSNATAHFLDSDDNGRVVIVCLRGWEGKNPIEVAGVLVHEAVHIWQEYAFCIGEHNPGKEQEAYAIQAIAQELMAEFAERMK